MKAKDICQPNFLLLHAHETVEEVMPKVESYIGECVIVKRIEGSDVFFYLYTIYEVSDQLSRHPADMPLINALCLHEYTSTDVLQSNQVLDHTVSKQKRYVIAEGQTPKGYIMPMEDAMKEEAAPAIDDNIGEIDFSMDEMLEDIDRAKDIDLSLEEKDFIIPKPGSVDTGNSKGGSAPDTSTAIPPSPQEPSRNTFEAYPNISNPGAVEAGQKLKIYVGFSAELDTSLENVTKVIVEKPTNTENIYVGLVAFGADIPKNKLKPLPFDEEAMTSFNLEVHDKAQEVKLIATYYFKMQAVGSATRTLSIKGGAAPEKNTDNEMNAGGCALNISGLRYTNSKVDITVEIITDKVEKALNWRIVSQNPRIDTQVKVPIENTQAFAQLINTELKRESFKGQAAHNALQSLGLQIADHFPDEFFEIFNDVSQQIQQTPTVFIWTNEPYIPWELAFDKRFQLDKEIPAFLGLQTLMGRWWLAPRVVSPPPNGLEIMKIKALAADYDLSSGWAALKEAKKEQDFLERNFAAEKLMATKDAVLKLTSQQPAEEGLLLHMAIHGYSNAANNEQKIILEEGKELTPNAMFPPYNCGDVPAISFMFLNACQVGTAGTSLGQASGFPGALLRNGLLGFIAPLWEVHDDHARAFAENFYKKVLKNGENVSKALKELRKDYNYKESLTPLAYIYYGHPNLLLNYEVL